MPLSIASLDLTLGLVAASLLGLITIVAVRRRRNERGVAERAAKHDAIAETVSLEAVLAELEKLPEQLLAQTKSQAAALRAELHATNARLERLERELRQRTEVQQQPPSRLSTADIERLAMGGRPAIEIAESLGMPLGDVELTLNLRNFREGPQSNDRVTPAPPKPVTI